MKTREDGPRTEDREADVVEGIVERVTFSNDDTGFRVVRVRSHARKGSRSFFDPGSDLVTVVGRFTKVAAGENIRAIGKIEEDPRHGPQLRAEVVTTTTPTTEAGIERYLGSGIVPGIAKRTAKKVVSHFGTDTIRVLDQEPSRLREVPGLGATRADALSKAWSAKRVERELMVVLASLAIPHAIAARIYRRYGDGALDIVRRSPYRLALEVWGVGFKSADAIAHALGVGPDDPQRAQAGVLHTLKELSEEGHTVFPRQPLVARTAFLLDGNATSASRDETSAPDAQFLARAEEAIDALSAAQLVVFQPEGVAITRLFEHEQSIAHSFQRLLAPSSESMGTAEHVALVRGRDQAIARFEAATHVALAPAQREAIDRAARARVVVVTGGPGVGKTTVVRALLSLFEGASLRTALAAPTGRAAKRMTDATSHAALTNHRLLEVDPRQQRC
ncbi:MAG: hypothetical protein NVS3B20_21700 [Polyangiales bacterium]